MSGAGGSKPRDLSQAWIRPDNGSIEQMIGPQ